MNELQKNMFIGRDQYTKLLIHGNGANGSTEIIDSATNKLINVAGSTQISTAQAILTNSSILLNGTTDYLSIADSADWNFGADNFTIDFRVYFNSLTTTTGIFAQRTAYNSNLSVYCYITSADKKVYFYYSVNGTANVGIVFNTVIQTGQWYHLAIVRNGTELALYINGVKESSTIDISTNAIYNSDGQFSVGAMYSGSAFTSFASAYFKEFRVSKGIARYTANFTPSNHEYYI